MHRKRRLQRVLVAEVVRLLADGQLRITALELEPAVAGRTSPATRRSSEDLPTPLGPVTASASPAPQCKAQIAEDRRPPLTQARSDAASRIPVTPALVVRFELVRRGSSIGIKDQHSGP